MRSSPLFFFFACATFVVITRKFFDGDSSFNSFFTLLCRLFAAVFIDSRLLRLILLYHLLILSFVDNIQLHFYHRSIYLVFVLLLSAECFVRIYTEAMIPPERTFRTSDTNSLSVCRELCFVEGIRCQMFSLGISSRGNGTCQLSSDRMSENAGRRPRGTIYDPDFNLYQRKPNCGIREPNSTPQSEGKQWTCRWKEELILTIF